MANNKTGKDASGATFTYKTTDNAGVDTPHVIVDEIVTGTLTLTGEDHIGQVGGHTVVIKPTITVTAGAYSAGDVIGGEIALTSAMRGSGGSGVLTDFILTTADGETPELHVLIFDSNPASNVADNGAFSWGSGDWGRLIGDVHIAAADWYTLGADGVCHKQGVNMGVKASGSADLYCYIVAVGTPTFGATSDLTAAFKFLQD